MNEKIKALRSNSQEAQFYFEKILAYTLGPVELKSLMEKNDVELIVSHIPGAISIPKDELANNIEKLSKDKINVIYCYNQQCHLGARAALTLADYEYPVMLL